MHTIHRPQDYRMLFCSFSYKTIWLIAAFDHCWCKMTWTFINIPLINQFVSCESAPYTTTDTDISSPFSITERQKVNIIKGSPNGGWPQSVTFYTANSPSSIFHRIITLQSPEPRGCSLWLWLKGRVKAKWHLASTNAIWQKTSAVNLPHPLLFNIIDPSIRRTCSQAFIFILPHRSWVTLFSQDPVLRVIYCGWRQAFSHKRRHPVGFVEACSTNTWC